MSEAIGYPMAFVTVLLFYFELIQEYNCYNKKIQFADVQGE